MHKLTLFIALFLGFNTISSTAQDYRHTQEDLTNLKELMTGFFSTLSQWQEDTTYFYIRLCMQPVWEDSEPGYWLYVEQAAYGSPDKPYRQRIYHLFLHDSREAIVSKVYEILDPDYFVGACQNHELLANLTPEQLIERPGCELRLIRTAKDAFKGATREGACRSAWRGATWVSSDVLVTPEGLSSWDRGWDANGNLVWGPEDGGYRFDRVEEKEDYEEDEEEME